MSNSIWKMPDKKPERNEDILVEYTSTNGQSYYIVDSLLNKLLQPKRWAYLSDIIAQADKAERLRKAVDLALDMLLEISDGYDIMAADSETIKRLFYTIQDNAKNARDEIKQLTNGEADICELVSHRKKDVRLCRQSP